MKTYTKEELNEILRMHRLWVNSEVGGVRADLQDSDLRGSNLEGCDLSGSNLTGCDLRDSILRYSDLSGSNLTGCDLRYSDLRGSFGITYAQITFSGNGEFGRMLTAVVIDGSPVYFCGCFQGSYDQLITYIENGMPDLAEPRRMAARFVKASLEISIERAVK